MDTTILEDLGLTSAEIKVYLALLELGSTKAGAVLQKTGLQNSVVHMTLHKLVEEGFASFIRKGKVKYYQATDPSHILDFIDDKKERFKEILPLLLDKQKKHDTSKAEVYTGFKGFKTMLHEFISDAQAGDEYLIFSFYTSNTKEYEKLFNYYAEFETERMKKRIVVKLIAPKTFKELLKNRKAQKVFVEYPIPTNTSIFRDKIIFTPWEENQTVFMIHSKQLANEYRKFFYEIWNRETGKTPRSLKK